jgi:hypothetical protein
MLQVLVGGEEGVLYRVLSVFRIAEKPVGDPMKGCQAL